MSSGNISEENQIKQAKSKIELKNFENDYFLKEIFNFIKKNKTLEILKYNRELQKKLNLSINDYKEYSQLYSSIEIELKLDNDAHGEKNKFIYIPDKIKEYFHIYFDNSNEEIKRNYLNENEKVNKIKIIIDYPVKSFKFLFARCEHITSIFFKKFYRINITDMGAMFIGCSSLKEINLSNFNTNNLINANNMFYGCSSLKELNLFSTNNVKYMNHMFCGCSSLEKLDLSNFNFLYISKLLYLFNLIY